MTVSKQPADRWVKCISAKGNIRAVALQATGIVNQLAQAHELKGDALQALGEAVLGALTIASYCKDHERVNLNIRASGFVSQALVDAYPDGTIRGYVVPRDEGRVVKEDQGPWGEGLLSVLRTKVEEKQQPFIGTVPLLTGHLAKDLTFYWLQSEQVPSAVGLGIKRDGDRVRVAGGFLVQALPGASDQELKAVEKHINEIQSLAERLAEEADPIHLLSQIFQDTAFMLIEEKPLTFSCNCSWERVNRALTLVGKTELQSMLDEDRSASIRCDFCGKHYDVDADRLRRLIQGIKK